jgi:hypothetical protein
LESLRAIQAALAEIMAPELTSPYAQDAAQTVQMLIESLAAEWNTAAADLQADNSALRALLARTRTLFAGPGGNDRTASLVTVIDDAIKAPPAASPALHDLRNENESLRGALERALEALEDMAVDGAPEKVLAVRSAVYSHLRQAALRGWSFWDVASFRERINALRGAAS